MKVRVRFFSPRNLVHMRMHRTCRQLRDSSPRTCVRAVPYSGSGPLHISVCRRRASRACRCNPARRHRASLTRDAVLSATRHMRSNVRTSGSSLPAHHTISEAIVWPQMLLRNTVATGRSRGYHAAMPSRAAALQEQRQQGLQPQPSAAALRQSKLSGAGVCSAEPRDAQPQRGASGAAGCQVTVTG